MMGSVQPTNVQWAQREQTNEEGRQDGGQAVPEIWDYVKQDNTGCPRNLGLCQTRQQMMKKPPK